MALTKFLDALPIPAPLVPQSLKNGVPYYEVRMTEFQQTLHSQLPPTTVWGYEGSYPGPTIETKRNQPIWVKWINDLPEKHLLPVDKTVHGAGDKYPEVRTVVHLHGGRVAPENDGHPEAWFTKGFRKVGKTFKQKVYYYPNRQRATTLWYHDHALGITRLNVYAGLAAFYLIRDECEERLNLPQGDYEIPLVIQDRSFNLDGSLFYPTQPDPPAPVDPSVVPEFFGNTILVNGKVWPYLEVEPRKYRFRILNGSNARFYRLRLNSGQPFIVIGNEGGFFERPIRATQLTIAPAERYDVIVDFSNFRRGTQIIMTNDAPTPFPDGDPVNADTSQVMQFRVTLPLLCADESSIPGVITPIRKIAEASATKVRPLTLVETEDLYGRLLTLLDDKHWDDPVTERPQFGAVEIWNLINLTMDSHPIHLHLVHFQVLNRQRFDVERYQMTGELVFTGPPEIPPLPEWGWKDTVQAPPGQVTRIIQRFVPYAGDYVWHCHILEHEDHEMMRPYNVVPNLLYLLYRIFESFGQGIEMNFEEDQE